MLQVAFGQSKYYSDNLSENVKRGIRQKLRRGEWPSRAPFGYLNNPKTRNLEIDPIKSRAVKKAFEDFATSQYTLQSLSQRLSFYGVVSGSGKPLCKATLQRMLTNKAYLGLIEYEKETHEGCFPKIIDLATFEAVQKILKSRARPRKRKESHNFPLTGLLTCGECGAAITAQYVHGCGGTYRYCRCTKRLGPCSQKYLQEKQLAEQIKEQLQKVAISDEWHEQGLARIEKWKEEFKNNNAFFAQNLENKMQDTELKLNKLVDSYLEGTIEKETYLLKKEELIKIKTDLFSEKSDFGRKGISWIEPLQEFWKSAHQAKKLAVSNDLYEIKSFVAKNGTNRRLVDRKVAWLRKNPFPILAEKNESLTLSGWRDLNSQSPGPKPSALAN